MKCKSSFKVFYLKGKKRFTRLTIVRLSLFITLKHNPSFKDKDQLWSCDCIVKETLWNRSEKVDHLAYKYCSVLQGSGIIKMIRNLAQSS